MPDLPIIVKAFIMHIAIAPASFAQARIWLDERIRFDPDKPQIAIYNMPFVYRLQSGHTLSIKQLTHALHLTVSRHSSLHTSLHFDIQKNLLMQQVITHEDRNSNNNMLSIIETTYETEEQLNEILHDEKRNPHLFDLAQGLVFRCHIIYYKQISSNHLLSHKDVLIFNFHHALFDFPSMKVFHHDLNQAYTTGQLLYDDNTNLRYLDYAAIEQQMPMTGASMFWLDALHDCKLDQPLSLPFDRYRLSNEHRTGRGTSISFDFGQDLSHDFLIHASSNNISLEQLALAAYYVFLFKLTNGEKDLCIGINTDGRYRDELNSIIGMFVNAIPLRCQLDPHLSFDKFTKHVQDNTMHCIKYSYFPLQRILHQHPNISNPVFLDTSFEFISFTKRDETNEIMIDDSRFSLVPYSIKISEDEVMSKFDFILSFQHDLDLNEFSCTINASVDLFNAETVCTIVQRLQAMLHQQFTSFDSQINKPICELSLVLSNEQYLMQSLNNTQVSFASPLTCIHHEFAYQVMKHPQKLAVELDEQSLTYCELLYYVQVLALALLNEYRVIPGEVVCQCVERSLSMVIGIMAIEMAGGIYCPLSPRDPQHRLQTLTQQTQSRLVLVHHLTTTKLDHSIVSLNTDSVLNVSNMDSDMNYNCLSRVKVTGREIAYIIFTSGSTGTPKAVQVRHKNFIDCMHSLAYINSFNKDDTVVQMTRCSFDIHVQEILGILLAGGTLIMLHPAPASFAQARIWLDERIRFDPDKPQVAIYNMPFVYHLQSGHTISVKQLHQALRLTVNKHPSLHTSLHFDTQKNLLMQRVTTHEHKNNNNNLFSIIETIYETDEQLNEILHDERRNPHLFDLAQGLVFRCHIIYYKQISSNDLLSDHDLLIFNFHHALFDFPSMEVFHHDLNQAYTTSQLLYDDNTHLRYLDYAVIEQEMSMTGASMFWLDALHDCKLDQSLSLPFDRYRLSDEHRTGRGTSISFDFGQDLSHHFLSHASSNNISMEQLALATYYVFLFKLTNGEKDLCIGINTHGRYRDELSSIIGMFVNAIPLRCQLDPHLSFHKLTKHVQDTMINCIRYSYFPLQRILNQHPNISNPVFLDTSFDFVSTMKRDEKNEIMIGDSRLSLLPFSIKISEDEIMSKFDFILSFQHDLNLNEISCTIDASVDLFNPETICTIAQRLRTMLHQSSAWIIDNEINKPVFELSLILSNEQYLMQSLNNTQISFSSSPVTCIHHGFVYQVMKHPQKLAVELDEQSLTYCELLYYVQVLSCTLLKEYDVLPGEIVCQCVERSLSMVVGIMAIEMAGGVYCPLSPRDPQHRLHTLTQQTQSRLVLVHHITKTKFDDYIVPVDIDLILNINDIDKKGLSSVITKDEEIAYIIFTSGSTGTPKAVQVRHKNFIDSMHSLTYINSFNKGDTVVQMTRCSFDIHVQEILGTLLFGCTVIMLHPGGMTDFDYLSNVLQKKQITYLSTVPSLLHSFFIFIEHNKKVHAAIYLRSLCSGGGSFSVPLIDLIVKSGMKNCIVWNLYGPAEITITCTGHRVNATNGIQSIAIGRPLSNYRCMILTEYLQSSVIGQEGELLVGGVGVFAGYLGRDDLTAKALVEIDGQLFYRTGDLVRIDNNGLLHYQGRKDHQIKLHGQRIELGEIERCLLNITSISACVVVKWNDDYLVTYVQSSNINEEELRQHCESHLPPHMIPSIFIILDKLPLNPNGKIDRKQLPSPDFSLSTLLSSSF
ncbi:unnamed protein product [Adineta steineri]|uniref:Uncharacterized protein n=1 Tax=Adineta steineri TaxID=433720 RepID=A0A815DQA2_9BILA|nr:unnamed protein product [Adineta steineri]